MCEPTTILIATTLFSTALAAKSYYDQGQYQEGVGRYNARNAANQAQDTRNAANEDENAHRQRVAQLISRQRAQLGANNIDINSGSALQLQEDTAILGEADALRIRSNGGRQVSALNQSATLSLSDGKAAANAGTANAAGSILGGVSSFANSGVADKWFTNKSAARTGDFSTSARVAGTA